MINNKQWLESKYYKENLSLIEIGAIVGYSSEIVRRSMERLGIPRRKAAIRQSVLQEKYFNKSQLLKRFQKKYIITENGCWEWIATTDLGGYGSAGYKGKLYKAHRLSKFLFDGFDLESDLHVLHTCDNRKCVNPKHLFTGTHTDNMRDMFKKGKRDSKGIKNNRAKLNDKKVMEIRQRHKQGESQTKLGIEYNVPQSAIWKIVNYINWRHVEV